MLSKRGMAFGANSLTDNNIYPRYFNTDDQFQHNAHLYKNCCLGSC